MGTEQPGLRSPAGSWGGAAGGEGALCRSPAVPLSLWQPGVFWACFLISREGVASVTPLSSLSAGLLSFEDHTEGCFGQKALSEPPLQPPAASWAACRSVCSDPCVQRRPLPDGGLPEERHMVFCFVLSVS